MSQIPIALPATNIPQAIAEQSASRILAAGAVHAEHLVIISKAMDFAYEMDRKMVSLVQSLGVREVTSRSGQQGIPGAAGP